MLSLFHVGHNYWHPITATSFSQGNSSEFSPIMPEEFGEHLTRDQRPFSSSRITPDLQIHSFFSSVHSSSTGFRSENTWHEIRDHSFIQNHSRSSDSQLLLFSSPHSSSTGFRSENTWHEIRDHSFIQNHSRSFRFTASPLQFTHSSSTGFRSENTWHEIRDHSFIQNHSRSSDSQLLLFSSLTHLLQGSGQRTPDTRSETIPSSRITPDLQIHSFSSSVHSSSTGFRSENTWHEIRDHSFIQNHSRSSDSQLLLFSSLIFYRVQIREHLTRDQRPFLHPESLQIFRFTASPLQFTHLLQGSDQRTPDTRSETIPSSRITPDLQIHSFSSSIHSSSTGFRSENTWHEIRDHSFIQNHSRSFRFTASSLQFTSLIFYRVQIREYLTRDQRSFLHPESLQIFRFTASPLQFTHLLQGSDQRTPDTRSETIPSSRITPDLQIHSFFSSVHSSSTGFRSENTWQEIRDHSFIQNHSRSSDSQLLLFSSLTHLLQGSDQRTPDTRSETIPSSRITPDLQIHSFFSSVHSLIFYRVQIREHLTRDQRSFLHPESLQIFRFTASPLQFTHLLQGSDQRTPDTRSETIPSSRITPDLQIHSFSSSVHSSSTGFRSENTWHEIRDHFLHPESLQILQIHSFFSSVHSSSTGFRSENTWQEIRDHSFIQNHSRSSDSQLLLFSSPHSSSTGFRSENTWHEIRDHSFIQNHSRSSDSQLLLFSSPHSSSTGFRSENTWHEIRDHSFIQNHSRSSDSQLLLFSSLIFYRVQIREHLTRDQRPFSSSRITPDLQIHSFFSSIHLTHFLQGSGQRTETAMVKDSFCAQWPIFVFILMFVLDCCPAGRSKHGPL